MQRPDRRSQIVQIAFQLVAERGLEGLRFGDIARAAGINNGTLLYYFPGKEALIQAVGAYLVQQYSETAWPESTERPDPLVALEHEFADARDRLGTDLGVVYTELLARARRDPAIAQILRDIDAGWRSWLASILSHGRAIGVIRADLDPEVLATLVMATIRGVGMQSLVAEDPQSVAPVMDALVAQFMAWVRNTEG